MKKIIMMLVVLATLVVGCFGEGYKTVDEIIYTAPNGDYLKKTSTMDEDDCTSSIYIVEIKATDYVNTFTTYKGDRAYDLGMNFLWGVKSTLYIESLEDWGFLGELLFNGEKVDVIQDFFDGGIQVSFFDRNTESIYTFIVEQ